MHQFHADAVPDIEAFEPADDAAFGRRPGNAYPRSLVRRAGHDRIEARADARGKNHGGRRLSHLAFHFRRIVLLVRAVARQRRKFVGRVRRRLQTKRRLQQTLRDEVGKPAIRRRRMRVVLHGQSEMPFGWLARHVERIFASAQQLDDGKGKIGKAGRVDHAAPGQKCVQRGSVRGQRQALPRLGRQCDDPVPALRRAQHPAQRRHTLGVKIFRGDAVGRDHEVLDQFLRPVPFVRHQVGEFPVVEHRPGFQRFQVQRTVGVAHPFQCLRGPILDANLFIQPGHGRELWGWRRSMLEPCGEPIVGKLGAIEDGCRVNVGSRQRAIAGDHHFHDDRQPFLTLAQ